MQMLSAADSNSWMKLINIVHGPLNLNDKR